MVCKISRTQGAANDIGPFYTKAEAVEWIEDNTALFYNNEHIAIVDFDELKTTFIRMELRFTPVIIE